MSKTKQALETLKMKREHLDARIQAEEARLKTSERKKDMRRKILVGSYYLDKAKKEGTLEELKNNMQTFLTRTADKTLFDLDQSSPNHKNVQELKETVEMT